jgi:methionyl-tRNA formyltransferase
VNFNQSAQAIHNFIRGMDSAPGAWTVLEGQNVKLFGSKLWSGHPLPEGQNVNVAGMEKPAIIHSDGLLLHGNDGKAVNMLLKTEIQHRFQEITTKSNVVRIKTVAWPNVYYSS